MAHHLLMGVAGDQGSFSEQAALLYAARTGVNYNFNYLIDMENVLAAVAAGHVDIGIFPVINLSGGLVKMAFEAMGAHLFNPVDELWLDVKQCLLTQPDVKSEQITKIISHSQAIKQCQHYLTTHFSHAEIIEWEDTASAARHLANTPANDTAVIASSQAATIYGLSLLAENMQDNTPNFTVFIIAKRRETTL